MYKHPMDNIHMLRYSHLYKVFDMLTFVYVALFIIRYPSIRFIAALGDPKSSSGSGAGQWGLWRDDPGPRGVFLKDYDRRLGANDNVAPAGMINMTCMMCIDKYTYNNLTCPSVLSGWKFDPKDWWVEEHGLI